MKRKETPVEKLAKAKALTEKLRAAIDKAYRTELVDAKFTGEQVWVVRGPDNRIVAREPTRAAAESLRDYLNSPADKGANHCVRHIGDGVFCGRPLGDGRELCAECTEENQTSFRAEALRYNGSADKGRI